MAGRNKVTYFGQFCKFILLSFISIFIANCAPKVIGSNANDLRGNSKDFTNYDLAKLLKVKSEIESANYNDLDVYKEIVANGNDYLDETPKSVMDKTKVAASGDKHDYFSLGPYWWPDPNKTDGLPWIRRDGEINPLTRKENVDKPAKDEVFDAINSLAKAYFFSNEKKYAEKAQDFIHTWFVNPETRMNPNLNYAQGIPGRNDGRCFGIIEFTGISGIITSLEMLDYGSVIDKEIYNATKTWMIDYQNWLLTSELGIQEKSRSNNHATWFDYQVVVIYIFNKEYNKAKYYLENTTKPRISKQIEIDGSQPHELARTKSLSYSTMNLVGWTRLAYLGNKVGVDLWGYTSKEGSSIKQAYEYLYPFALGDREWEKKQISSLDKVLAKLQDQFRIAGGIFEEDKYCAVGIKNNERTSSLENLLFSCQE